MKKTNIRVFTKLNDIEENNEFLAIKDDNLIKYIDLEDNKMTIDMEKNIIIRENKDYLFNMDFNNNIITINIKKIGKVLEKEINTMIISKSETKYLIRYLLTDENIINEYYVKF